MLQEHYKIPSDWKGGKYLSLDLDWNYDNTTEHLFMLGYVAESITRFRHKHPHKPQDHPYLHIQTNYGAKANYSESTDDFPPLSK